MKKLIAVIVILVCAGSALFALDLNFSAGAGMLYKVDSSTTTGTAGSDKMKTSGSLASLFGAEAYNFEKFGGFYGFFDATFVEASMGLLFSKSYDVGFVGGGILSLSATATCMQLGLLGKFPIELSNNISVFPLAGFQLNVPLSVKFKDVNSSASVKEEWDEYSRFDMSQFWIRFGAGMDIDITRNIYVRPSAVWGIRFANKMEKDLKTLMKDFADVKVSYFNRGFEFRLAAGYRF